jgi:hypothetical protein
MTAPEGAQEQEGGIDPGKLARQLAHQAVQEPAPPAPEGQPPAPPKGVPSPPAAPPAAPTAEEPSPTVTEEQVEELAEETGVPFADLVDELAGYGISVETEDIPKDLYDPFTSILTRTKAAVEPLMERTREADEAISRYNQLKERLAGKPESVLLTLWATKPEVFAKVAEMVERANSDEEYRATVLRELSLDAREAELVARESTTTQQSFAEKGRRAAALTEAAAARYGVKREQADKYVAAMISAVGPQEFKLTDIDGLVKDLAPAQPRPKPPKTVTPQQQQAVQHAPTPSQPAAPAAPPGSGAGLSPETSQPGRGGFFRGLVRQAAQRVDERRQP